MSNLKVGTLYTESFAGMTTKEIKDNMSAICYRVEEKEYVHQLSKEELAQKHIELSEAIISLDKLEEEKKEVVSQFKISMEPAKNERTKLIENIKFRSERKHGQLFHIDDQDNRRMFIYDENGMCIDERPFTASETQTRMRQLNKVVNE